MKTLEIDNRDVDLIEVTCKGCKRSLPYKEAVQQSQYGS